MSFEVKHTAPEYDVTLISGKRHHGQISQTATKEWDKDGLNLFDLIKLKYNFLVVTAGVDKA